MRAERLQNERTQKELERLRLAAPPAKRSVAPTQAPNAGVRENLNRILDAAPETAHRLPVDGFADTLPSQQFADTGSFGLLHRASTFSKT